MSPSANTAYALIGGTIVVAGLVYLGYTYRRQLFGKKKK